MNRIREFMDGRWWIVGVLAAAATMLAVMGQTGSITPRLAPSSASPFATPSQSADVMPTPAGTDQSSTGREISGPPPSHVSLYIQQVYGIDASVSADRRVNALRPITTTEWLNGLSGYLVAPNPAIGNDVITASPIVTRTAPGDDEEEGLLRMNVQLIFTPVNSDDNTPYNGERRQLTWYYDKDRWLVAYDEPMP